jgi:hypothetical protein
MSCSYNGVSESSDKLHSTHFYRVRTVHNNSKLRHVTRHHHHHSCIHHRTVQLSVGDRSKWRCLVVREAVQSCPCRYVATTVLLYKIADKHYPFMICCLLFLIVLDRRWSDGRQCRGVGHHHRAWRWQGVRSLRRHQCSLGGDAADVTLRYLPPSIAIIMLPPPS